MPENPFASNGVKPLRISKIYILPVYICTVIAISHSILALLVVLYTRLQILYVLVFSPMMNHKTTRNLFHAQLVPSDIGTATR